MHYIEELYKYLNSINIYKPNTKTYTKMDLDEKHQSYLKEIQINESDKIMVYDNENNLIGFILKQDIENSPFYDKIQEQIGLYNSIKLSKE